MFEDNKPNHRVDEVSGRIFNLKDEKELSAFSVQ
jgi:hypothetical protein